MDGSAKPVKMLDEARRAQLREWARQGGRKRAEQFTPESQRAARAHVKRESLQESGRRGQAVMLARHGEAFRTEHLAEHRRLHPSDLEIVVLGWLHEMRVPFRRDVPVAGGRFFIDLTFDRIALEVDGRHWHTNNGHHGEDREARDAEKDQVLAEAGYTVIRLDEAAIRDGSARTRLAEIIDSIYF